MKTLVRHDKRTKRNYLHDFTAIEETRRWLCYTLTGDEELSDKVVDGALEQSLKDADRVFHDWMSSWARRQIIKLCIAAVRPRPSSTGQCLCSMHREALGSVVSEQLDLALTQPPEVLQQKLLGLDPLTRFVFVLRALEGYSRRDTALLLNLDDQTCEAVYQDAVEAVCSNLHVMTSLGTGMELLTA